MVRFDLSKVTYPPYQEKIALNYGIFTVIGWGMGYYKTAKQGGGTVIGLSVRR